jgi:lysozyme family protein
VFDWAVNGGNARARRYLQCVVGAKVDRIIGEVTEDHIALAEEPEDIATMLQLRAMH